MTGTGASVEDFAELLCDLAFEAMSLVDANGLVRHTTDKQGQLVAAQPGKPGTFAQVHPDDLEEAQRSWRALLASPGAANRSCLRMKHTDGSWRWIETSSRNLLEDPRVKWVVINWRDVTAAKQTEQAHRLIAENAHDLILRIGKDGALTYVSPSSKSVLGRTPEELFGTDFYVLVHPEDVVAVRKNHSAASEPLNAVPTYRCRRREGS